MKDVILIVDEVDQLLAEPELLMHALNAKMMIGLSASLGGEVGLKRYEDFFKGHAHYQWLLPEHEGDLDLERLRLDTWVSAKKIPYDKLARLILDKRSKLGLPTLILAENAKQQAKIAAELQKLDDLKEVRIYSFDA